MAMNYLTRRSFMQALGAGGMALPFAPMLESSVAEAQAAPPLRLILMCTPHGKVPEFWDPQGGETDFNISYPNAILAPLEKFRSRLLIPLGIDMRVLYEKGDETGHMAGPCSLFTGTPAITKGDDLYPTGPSLDQALAQKFGGTTKLRSVQLGVLSQAGQTSFDSFIFGEAGVRLPGLDDPAKAYARLFADLVVNADPGLAQRAIARKQSVIDLVKGDLDRMGQRLAGPEKQKLDAHLAALRDIESRLGLSTPLTCQKPVQPARSGQKPADIPNIGKLQLDLIAQACACDLSRFFSLQWLYGGDSTPMPWLGLDMNLHDDVAHMIEESDEARLQIAQIQNWYASQLLYLMEKLDLIQEGDGTTALDHTVILWGNELGNPAAHDNMDQPFLIAGGCGGKFRMGRTIKYHIQEDIDTVTKSRYQTMTAHNRLLVSIAQAFGWELDYFNDPDYGGALAEFV